MVGFNYTVPNLKVSKQVTEHHIMAPPQKGRGRRRVDSLPFFIIDKWEGVSQKSAQRRAMMKKLPNKCSLPKIVEAFDPSSLLLLGSRMNKTCP